MVPWRARPFDTRLVFLCGERRANELFGVRIGNNINRLRFVLQGTNDIVQKLLAVREKGRDYILTRRAYRHAISGLVVGAE